MKTKLLLSALLTFSFLLSPCTAQVPQGFNYQAIARDGSGNPITGATIKVKLSVLSDTTGFYSSGSGAYIWEEEHLNVKPILLDYSQLFLVISPLQRLWAQRQLQCNKLVSVAAFYRYENRQS